MSAPESCKCHALFRLFLSDDIKQDAVTITSHIKCIIEFLKQHRLMPNMLSTIWENIDGCDEHYICATALYLMSMLSQDFYVIIDRGISSPGHGREVVDGLNTIEKRFLFQLMPTVQLPVTKGYGTQMVMHTETRTSNVSLANVF